MSGCALESIQGIAYVVALPTEDWHFSTHVHSVKPFKFKHVHVPMKRQHTTKSRASTFTSVCECPVGPVLSLMQFPPPWLEETSLPEALDQHRAEAGSQGVENWLSLQGGATQVKSESTFGLHGPWDRRCQLTFNASAVSSCYCP